MFVHEAAVIGGDGGGPYSHAADLEAAGHRLGAGPNCMRLSALHVEKWQVLSHHSATYTSMRDPTQTFTTPGRGGIRTETSTDFHIPSDHRVRRVCAAAGDRHWAAGGRCLNSIEIEIVPAVVEAEDVNAHARVAAIGQWPLRPDDKLQPGIMHWGRNGATCKVLVIPEGLTLVGIAGRAGDSWDQVSLLVGPWLPMGGWSPSVHTGLVTPFKQQVRSLLLCLHQLQASAAIQTLDKKITESLVAALFDATFMTAAAAAAADGAHAAEGAGPADDFVAAWVGQQARAECCLEVLPGATYKKEVIEDLGFFDSSDDLDDPSDYYENYED